MILWYKVLDICNWRYSKGMRKVPYNGRTKEVSQHRNYNLMEDLR